METQTETQHGQLKQELKIAWEEIERLKSRIEYLETIRPAKLEIVKAVLSGTSSNMDPAARLEYAYAVAELAVKRWEKDGLPTTA